MSFSILFYLFLPPFEGYRIFYEFKCSLRFCLVTDALRKNAIVKKDRNLQWKYFVAIVSWFSLFLFVFFIAKVFYGLNSYGCFALFILTERNCKENKEDFFCTCTVNVYLTFLGLCKKYAKIRMLLYFLHRRKCMKNQNCHKIAYNGVFAKNKTTKRTFSSITALRMHCTTNNCSFCVNR